MAVRLSPKHGVNPMLVQCFICGDASSIALCGRLPDDAEAPRMAVLNKAPCDNCRKIMAVGVILISVKDGTDPENPYRTGGWIALKDEAISRCFPPEQAAQLFKTRAGFIEDRLWKQIGLPEYGQPLEGVPNSMEAFQAQQAKGTNGGNDHAASPETGA